jgi:hypothetical protein
MPGERRYKLEDSAKLLEILREVLEGEADWERFFKSGRKFLTNQLGWRVVAGLDYVSKSDPSALTAAVKELLESCDANRFWSRLESTVGNELNSEECKAFRGSGSRASVASFFLLLQNPNSNPIYRPQIIGTTLSKLTGASVTSETPNDTLRSYYEALDALMDKFRENGLAVQDRLDVQGAIWSAKHALDKQEGKDNSKVRSASSENGGPKYGSRRAMDAGTLDDLASHLRARGLHYDRHLLAAYLAALMTKGFVILTGLSGSGKTRLALDAGRCLGAARLIPVRPDWTDSKGAFGYLNPLTGTYQRTPALDFILAAEKHSEVPYFLVLDEMNLAHVERYFSDVLSAVESREPIPLHDQEQVQTEQGVPCQLFLPPNLMIVGTVNIDETAYPFSPKVLDRAFVIDMSQMDLPAFLANARPNPESKDSPVAVSLVPLRDWRGLPVEEADQEWLLDVHDTFNQHGWPFGYRVAEESLAFLGHARLLGLDDDSARDHLLISKMLPKLHGNRTKLESLIVGLRAFLNGESPHDAAEALYPRALEKLELVERQLQDEGYAAALG